MSRAASPGGTDAAAAAEEAGDGAGGARVVAAIEAALALAPRDPLEGMLITQMAGCHAAATRRPRRPTCASRPG